MYRVTKSIEFCYGHRLLNYEGPCRHLHGHNGRIEIELAGDALDARGMLADFADIKQVVTQWVDENLDHKMILKDDDPLIDVLRAQGEPHYALDDNPTAEALARLIFRKAREMGLPIVKVSFWETPSSWATYDESS